MLKYLRRFYGCGECAQPDHYWLLKLSMESATLTDISISCMIIRIMSATHEQSVSKWPTLLGVMALIAIVGALDWVTGYELSFFAFYFLPVSLAAWQLGLLESLVTAFVCAVVWFWVDFADGHSYSSHFYAVWATLMRLGAFAVIGVLVSHIRKLLLAEKQSVARLLEKTAAVKAFGGKLLLICMRCKKIRNEQGVWQPIGSYISTESIAIFSINACPECEPKSLEADGIHPSPPSPLASPK